jgi:hypothetical protein
MPKIGDKYKIEVDVNGEKTVGCITFRLTLKRMLYDEEGYRQYWEVEYYKRPAVFSKKWETAGTFKVFTDLSLPEMCVDYVKSLGYDVGWGQLPITYLWG